MLGRLFRREEEPWEGEAKISRPWVVEAKENLDAAELDIARTQSRYHAALADAEQRLEAALAEIEKAEERLRRVEQLVDRIEGADARRTEERLRKIEAVLQRELRLVRV